MITQDRVIQSSSQPGYLLSYQHQVDPGLVLTLGTPFFFGACLSFIKTAPSSSSTSSMDAHWVHPNAKVWVGEQLANIMAGMAL
jgi:hypothetical protein